MAEFNVNSSADFALLRCVVARNPASIEIRRTVSRGDAKDREDAKGCPTYSANRTIADHDHFQSVRSHQPGSRLQLQPGKPRESPLAIRFPVSVHAPSLN